MSKYEPSDFLFCINNKECYRDGDRMVMLYPEGTKKSLVMLEATNQSIAEELGVAVPRITDVVMINSRWALVCEYVGNRLLSDYTRDCGWEESVLNKYVELELLVHSKKSIQLPKLRDIMQRQISDVKLDGTARYKLHTALDDLPKHNKLCHGKMLPSCIIIGEGGELYLTDWLYASQGNSSFDASYAYLTLLLDYGTEIAERYITAFCRRSDIARQYVERWMAIVAATMLAERGEEGQKILMKYIKQ